MTRTGVEWSYRHRIRNLAANAALGIGGWLAYEAVYRFGPGMAGLDSVGMFQGARALFSQLLLWIGVLSGLAAVGYWLYVAGSGRTLDDGRVSDRTKSYIDSRRGALRFWFPVAFGYLPVAAGIVALTALARRLGASRALEDAVLNAFLGMVRISGIVLGLILVGYLAWYSVLVVASYRGDERVGIAGDRQTSGR